MAGYTHGRRSTDQDKQKLSDGSKHFASAEIETLRLNGAELLCWADIPSHGWVEYIERKSDHPMKGHPFYYAWKSVGDRVKSIKVVGGKDERQTNIQVWYARIADANDQLARAT